MPFRSPVPRRDDSGRARSPTFVLANVDAHRDRPALVDASSGHTITFGELADRIRRLAAGLSRRGIGKGDVVAIWAPNLPDYAVVFHAVARLGAVLTPANPTYTVEELSLPAAGRRRADAGDDRRRSSARAREAVAATPQAIEIVTIDRADGVPGARGHRGGCRAAGGDDRSGQRRGRAALLVRHHRPAQGGDADASQSAREPRADRCDRSTRTCVPSSGSCRSSTSTAWSSS